MFEREKTYIIYSLSTQKRIRKCLTLLNNFRYISTMLLKCRKKTRVVFLKKPKNADFFENEIKHKFSRLQRDNIKMLSVKCYKNVCVQYILNAQSFL